MAKEAPQNRGADPPTNTNNLNIMAAAAERLSCLAEAAASASEDNSSAGPTSPNDSASPSATRPKLVLPALTAAVEQDLALTKGSSRAQGTSAMASSKPLSIESRPEYADYPLCDIATPHPNDVLCGRGGGSNNHPGNESFRELVNEVKVPYVNCPKREKPLIARRIVEAVRKQTPPGRFLSKNVKTGLWKDIGDGKAREKTSQALREGAPIIRDIMRKPANEVNKIRNEVNVAVVLKEAKKAEREDKEHRVNSSGEPEDASQAGANAQVQDSPSFSAIALAALKRGKSVGHSPPTMVLSNDAPVNVPPLQRFQSVGTGGASNDGQPPVAWPPEPHHLARNLGQMPWQHAQMQRAGGGFASALRQHAGGFAPIAPPPPAPVQRSPDMVPVETVRRLLLGQLDPVQLALQILSPEEVAIVARLNPTPPAGIPQNNISANRSAAPAVVPSAMTSNATMQVARVVSDVSTASSMPSIVTLQTRQQSPLNPPQSSGDEASSVDSSKRERALPKKKRKYIEAS
ncbi:hypothetical protein ACHAXT_004559 [Thalassiosira profunda]